MLEYKSKYFTESLSVFGEPKLFDITKGTQLNSRVMISIMLDKNSD